MEDRKIAEGSVLECSWGYDQTNIDFFKVLSVKNGWAWIVPVAQEIVEYQPSYMGEKVMPLEEVVTGPKFRRKIGAGGEYVKIRSYSGASVWNGKPKMQTHTH
jgi:hypothetical protein